MSSFASLGGVLSLMRQADTEAASVALLAESKGPAELVILAKTAQALRAQAVFRAVCLAIFKDRTPEQVRESFGVADDLTPGNVSEAENERNVAVKDLTAAIQAETILPLLTWADLDTCSQVCRHCRDWAKPEMEKRVRAAMAGEGDTGDDPTFAIGSVRDLARAQERIAGVRRIEGEGERAGADAHMVDLSGVQLSGAGWAGIIGAITGAPELCEVNLQNCLIPKATCYDLIARFFEQCPVLQHVETDRAGDDGDSEGWVFSLWRLHTNQLDRPVEVVHARSEIFLLNVHLDASEWERVLEKLIGSPCLERLILAMCWIPHSCAGTLARVFTSCPHLSMGPLGGAMVDASWAGDDRLEFGWVDTMWHQVKGGQCHGDGTVSPLLSKSGQPSASGATPPSTSTSVVPKAVFHGLAAAGDRTGIGASTSSFGQPMAGAGALSMDPMVQIRSRRVEMERRGFSGSGGSSV